MNQYHQTSECTSSHQCIDMQTLFNTIPKEEDDDLIEASSSAIYDSHLSHQSICKTLDSIIPRITQFLDCACITQQQHQEENRHINTNLEMMGSSMDMERIGPGFDLPLFASHGTRSFQSSFLNFSHSRDEIRSFLVRYFSDNIVRDVLTNYSRAEESTFGVKYFLVGGLGAFVSVLADVGDGPLSGIDRRKWTPVVSR
ncbi:unnamed protein product [Sphagnum balticum]